LKHQNITDIKKSHLLCSCIPYTVPIRSYPRGSRGSIPPPDTLSNRDSQSRISLDDIGESLRALELGISLQSRDSESKYLRDQRRSKSEREIEESRDLLSRSLRDTESKPVRNTQSENSLEDIGESLRALELDGSVQSRDSESRYFRDERQSESERELDESRDLLSRDAESKSFRNTQSETILEQDKLDIVQNNSLPQRLEDVNESYVDAWDQQNFDLSVDVNSLSMPELARYANNIVPFVNKVPSLQKMVQLGVNLSIVQRYEGIGVHLLRSNFEKDIAPFVRFLVDIGVAMDKVGKVLTFNPLILLQDGKELEKRVGYMIHKKFTLPEVGSMVTHCPMILLMKPEHLDKKLGTLQQSFHLTGPEVRQVAVLYPQILPYKRRLLAKTRFMTKESLGFTDLEMKAIVLKCPKVFTATTKQLVANMDYLHNTMLVPHELVITFPDCLVRNSENLKNRHLFLASRGRAQYDPCVPRYVSLQALTTYDDEIFCRDTAKCDVQDLYDFSKTF